MRSFAVGIVFIAFLTHACTLLSQSSFRVFRDTNIGVQFSYPMEWELSRKGEGPIDIGFEPDAQQLAVFLTQSDTVGLHHTTFRNAELLYAIRRVSREHCVDDIATPDNSSVDSELRMIHGVEFTHVSAVDDSMCHYISDELYTTYRNGACHIFDLAFETVCFDDSEPNGQRPLTKSERQEIEATLDRILSTVEFIPKAQESQ